MCLNGVEQQLQQQLNSQIPEPRDVKEPGDAPMLLFMAHTGTLTRNCSLMHAVRCDY